MSDEENSEELQLTIINKSDFAGDIFYFIETDKEISKQKMKYYLEKLAKKNLNRDLELDIFLGDKGYILRYSKKDFFTDMNYSSKNRRKYRKRHELPDPNATPRDEVNANTVKLSPRVSREHADRFNEFAFGFPTKREALERAIDLLAAEAAKDTTDPSP